MKITTLNLQQGAYCTKLSDYIFLPVHMIPKLFYNNSMIAINALSEYIKEESIEIIFFTELDGCSMRTKFKKQIDTISELSGLENRVFFPTYKFGKYIDQGNGILTSYPLLSTKHIKLPGNGQTRYLSNAIIKTKNKKISLYVTHLALGKKDRIEQIKFISEQLKKEKLPIILTGDFNTESKEELAPLNYLRNINTFKTYPSWQPKKQFDQVYISKHLKLGYISPVNKLFSDHKGLEYELRL